MVIMFSLVRMPNELYVPPPFVWEVLFLEPFAILIFLMCSLSSYDVFFSLGN